MNRSLEIMDTTLRDGEQTSGVSYSPKEKLTIAKLLLDELKIDREPRLSTNRSNEDYKKVAVKNKLTNDFISWHKQYNNYDYLLYEEFLKENLILLNRLLIGQKKIIKLRV